MQNLRNLRKEKNLTIRDLQSIFGIGKSTLSLYENEKRDADYKTLKKIADYFGVSIDYILGRTDCRKTFTQEEYYNIIRLADKLGLTVDELLGGKIDDTATVEKIYSVKDKVRERAEKQGVNPDIILSDEQIDMFIEIAQKLKAKK
ncbi:MAG: helix-turn-helix transcriptional regulator [Clostridia bacterium]|nr:helix-turn-helix transcriptional regulator [Clostridia bacterium]